MKTKQQHGKRYARSVINNAIHAIQRGIPIRASKIYEIPKTTLHDKFENKSQIKSTMGPPIILPSEKESQLVNWILYVSERGFPVTKEQLLDSVQLLIKQLQKENPFTTRPDWYESFICRHPELLYRVAQNLTTIRASVNEDLRK